MFRLVRYRFVISTSSDCLGRFVPEMTWCVEWDVTCSTQLSCLEN